MRRVISNTTPIVALLKIGHLHLLEGLYGQVIVPKAVWMEIEAGRSTKYYVDLSSLPWISIQALKGPERLTQFKDLDSGVAEVLALAQEIQADLVIIDEVLARLAAKHVGLCITGTLGVLLRAKEQGIISGITPLIIQLTEQGIWLSKALIQEILQLSGEIKSS